jgi:VRR-NUC domain
MSSDKNKSKSAEVNTQTPQALEAFTRMSSKDFLAQGLSWGVGTEGRSKERSRGRTNARSAANANSSAKGANTKTGMQLRAPACAPLGAESANQASRRLLKKRSSPEEDLQRLVFAWIFAHEGKYPFLRYFLHVPNGGARSKGEAGKLKAMGVRKGVSDVIYPFASPSGKYLGFACELKSQVGRLSAEQKDFLVTAQEHGWLCAECRTLDAFIEQFDKFNKE